MNNNLRLKNPWATQFYIYFLVFCCLLPIACNKGRKGVESKSNCEIVSTIDKINPSNLKETITYLQNFGNRKEWEKQWETAKWILGQFKKYGIEVKFHTYEHEEKTWPNVVAKIEGVGMPDQVIMVLAHLDSTTDNPHSIMPGADDNASGVASILEIARILKKIPLNRSLMFIIFSNEERGTLGSKAFVQDVIHKDIDIQAVINLDILGYNRPDRPSYFKAVQAHKTFKHKLKAIFRISKNCFSGYFHGKDILKVVGNPPNSRLVEKISKIIRQCSDLKVKEIVKEDCG